MKRAAIVLLVLVSLFSFSAFAKSTTATSHGKQIAGMLLETMTQRRRAV